jgi:hypothetical protein
MRHVDLPKAFHNGATGPAPEAGEISAYKRPDKRLETLPGSACDLEWTFSSKDAKLSPVLENREPDAHGIARLAAC